MANVIIGVHGLANKPPKATLELWWRQAINEGLEWIESDVRLAPDHFHLLYWADVMYVQPQGEGKNEPFHLEQTYTPATSKPKEAKENVLDWAVAASGDWVDDVLDRVGLLDDVADVLLAVKLKDLATYWNEQRVFHGSLTAKQFLCGSLRDLIQQTGSAGHRIMLVAHSMGSIIAFDTLHDNPELRIDTFVTIGSPLGISRVKRRCAQQSAIRAQRNHKTVHWPVIPPGIGKWLNFADRRDPVAVDSSLGDDYLTLDGKRMIEDHMVINDYHYRHRSRTKSNPHKSYGYLRCPEVARAIRDFLSSIQSRASEV